MGIMGTFGTGAFYHVAEAAGLDISIVEQHLVTELAILPTATAAAFPIAARLAFSKEIDKYNKRHRDVHDRPHSDE